MSSGVKLTALATAMALSAFAGPVAAQQAPFISISGDAPSEWTLEEREQITDAEAHHLLRRVAPIGDLAELISDNDPFVIEAASDGELSDFVNLWVMIDADGRASDCSVAGSSLPADPDGLCDRVSAKLRMIPALDRAGARTSDFYDLTIAVDSQDLPPPPRLIVRSVGHAPLRNTGLTALTGGFENLIGDPLSPGAYGRPTATVEVRPDERGHLKCTLRSYREEETAFNTRACATALTGRFDFTGANAGKTAHLMFFEQDGRLAVLLPVSAEQRKGAVQAETMAPVRAALTADAADRLRFDFWVDRNGRIGDCMITVSSGDDAQDLAGCDGLQRLGRFERSLDPFGRAVPQQLMDWSLPGSAR